jgi:hypothetical protein
MNEERHQSQVSQLPEGALKQFTLPSGKQAVIYEGYGYHSNQAMEIAGANQGAYLNALMSLLVTVDGEKMRPDQFEMMRIKDYLAIKGEFAEQNFS